jgi:ABC-type nitrate/sulfonate/bicarbonate transport system ATPase subunit
VTASPDRVTTSTDRTSPKLTWLWRWLVLAGVVAVWQLWTSQSHSAFFPELVSIVGPSGCGKSTVLRCIAGLLAPTSGQVMLCGEPVEHVPDRLAVVFQEYGRSLYPWLTVRYNVALPLRQRQRNRTQRRQTAEESLAAVGLTGVSARYPWQLCCC